MFIANSCKFIIEFCGNKELELELEPIWHFCRYADTPILVIADMPILKKSADMPILPKISARPYCNSVMGIVCSGVY